MITRYNLSSKISSSKDNMGSVVDGGEVKESNKAGWSQNKNERQATLQRRREEMILAARKKMMDKEAQAKKAGS